MITPEVAADCHMVNLILNLLPAAAVPSDLQVVA